MRPLRWSRVQRGVYDSEDGRFQLTRIPAQWELLDSRTDNVIILPTKVEAQTEAERLAFESVLEDVSRGEERTVDKGESTGNNPLLPTSQKAAGLDFVAGPE